jgi:hypothetical protein
MADADVPVPVSARAEEEQQTPRGLSEAAKLRRDLNEGNSYEQQKAKALMGESDSEVCQKNKIKKCSNSIQELNFQTTLQCITHMHTYNHTKYWNF